MSECFGIVKYLDVIYIINGLKGKNKCDPFRTRLKKSFDKIW